MQAQGAVQHEEPPAEQVPAQPLAQNGKPSTPEAEVRSLSVSLHLQKAAQMPADQLVPGVCRLHQLRRLPLTSQVGHCLIKFESSPIWTPLTQMAS